VSYLGGDYAIWVVVGALYVTDAARLLAHNEFLLVETARGTFAPALSEAPFTLAGRVVSFGPLLRPDRAVFVLRWGDRWADPMAMRVALRRVTDLCAALVELRLVVAWAWVWLLLGGPALTFWLGPSAAIYCTMAAVYPATIIAAIVLGCRRRSLRLSGTRVARLIAEAFVCPPSLPNLLRKVTVAEPPEVDGVQIALALLEAGRRARFMEAMEHRAEELLNEMEPDDPEGQRLLSYMTTARAAR
jgi:hypothetical protein